ncbi:MAG: ATP-binding protein [Polyangiaceae bacterium]|nr:ATP-binding protein [Polyangiaceae bacterium]
MRFFNTAGPCVPERHYMVPAAERLPDARRIIDQGGYFVVHAPRQTGKTTTLRALARELLAEGRYAVLHTTCEIGEPAGDDYVRAQRGVLDEIRMRADQDLPRELRPPPWPAAEDTTLLSAGLRAWAEVCPRPLVLFLDEIDALRGEGLRSVLRQLRAGYDGRPQHFPWSVVLCGLRDVRDYKIAGGGDPDRIGTASPFNIKVVSKRLTNFDEEDVRALYRQHTEDTGQPFEDAAVQRVFALTAGQPWLVNSLAREVIEEMGVAPPAPITVAHVEQAKERLILARATHLDSLVSKLHEPRVRMIIEPILAGTVGGLDPAYSDNLSYVRDLGLVEDRPLRIANPIYREVIARVLADPIEDRVTADPRSFLLPDGRLDMDRLLHEFAEFWRQHADVLEGGLGYHEVAPQLVLMAYLQRIVNGGGYVDREYGVGRGRIDLCVRMPYTGADGKRTWQREALELKVWAPGRRDPLPQGLKQIEGYLDQLGLDRGVLVIFDRRPEAGSSEERTRFEEARTEKGYAVTVLRA